MSNTTPTSGFNAVELDDEVLDATTDKSLSQGRIVLNRFLHHRGAMVSMIVFLFVVIVAYTSIGFGPIPGWWPHSYKQPMPVVNGGAPTIGLFHLGEHPFGQDNVGKDYFALAMRGTQISIMIALVVGLVSTLIGTLVGALAGYFRGWVESLLMRITDMFIVIPLLILAAIIGGNEDIIGIAKFKSIFLEFWILTSTKHRIMVDHVRRDDFSVAFLTMFVQHEVVDSAF